MTTRDVAIEVADWLVGKGKWPPSPPPAGLPPGFAPLQRILRDDVLKETRFANLRVVILNFGPVSAPYPEPTCAYKDDTKRVPVGSTSKLAIFYAAFQLKADVQLALDHVAPAIAPRPPKLADLRGPLAEYWRSIPTLAELPVPDLESIFDEPGPRPGGGWIVAFRGISTCGHVTSWETLPERKQEIDRLCTAHQHEYKVGALKHAADQDPDNASKRAAHRAGLRDWQARIDALSFAERLWMTVRWSDNLAATQTAADIARSAPDASGAPPPITLAYVQALLKESGLGEDGRDDRDGRGLWLNGAWQAPASRPKNLKLWGKRPWWNADAQSLARLLLAMANGDLVTEPASSEMLNLLYHLDPVVDIVGVASYSDLDDRVDRPINWADSFIGTGMAFALGGSSIFSCASKIGIATDTIADWALVECRIGGARPDRYRFGVVIVNGERARNPNVIQAFAQTFFGKLKANDFALARS